MSRHSVLSDRASDDQAAGLSSGWPSLLVRYLWLCPILGTILAMTMLWVVGWGLWTSIVVALLIACPLSIVWALVSDRLQSRSESGNQS